MAGYVTVDSSHHGVGKSGQPGICNEELHDYGARWYFSRKEIEENSPSKRDGIDLKKETYLRKSYSTFLQDLGMRLRVPQVTIATAIVFCHRFFLRQSHAKNDRRTIATVCMFLAGKVEETPRPLKDVILASHEIIHKKDPSAAQKIKPKEAYDQQKELILLGEKLVLATLGFDMNVQHPYKPLVDAIKKFKVAKNALAKVAWNFVNDGLRTSLCLQFKPQHIAAGAIFLAAKFIKVKLPSDGDKAWWQEFNVTPRQLEDVSNQLLELYEQNHTAQFTETNHQPTGTTTSTVSENSSSVNNTVKKNDVIERKIDDRIDLAVEDEKIRMEKKTMGWPKPLRHLEQQNPLPPANMTRKPLGFVNGNADEQPKEEDGELSSIDEHDCSWKLQGYNAKRKLDEVWSDQSGRDHKRFR